MKYRFGSFNMNNMGMSAMTGRDFDRIAEIIKRENLDVVALQEILSEGKALEKLLEDRVKYCLKDWNVCWAKPPESSDIQKTKDNRGEGYAYLWNTKRLKFASSSTAKGERVYNPRTINEALRYDCTMFARTPYYATAPHNGVIPYQLHKRELVDILNNACCYLPFLNEEDDSGINVKEKILKIFEFRIPYYVGPLNPTSPNCWAVRFEGKSGEKIYPWNFDSVIDTEASAAGFIENLIGRCTYTGEKVLPKDSLLYSEFTLLNEMNMLRVEGKPLPQEVFNKLIDELFYKSKKKVTKKRIKSYLIAEGQINETDDISGIDDNVKASLKSYHDFKRIIDKGRP